MRVSESSSSRVAMVVMATQTYTRGQWVWGSFMDGKYAFDHDLHHVARYPAMKCLDRVLLVASSDRASRRSDQGNLKRRYHQLDFQRARARDAEAVARIA